MSDNSATELPKLEDCNPGYRPTGYNVVVVTAEKAKTSKSGLIIIPDNLSDRETLAQMKGLLVAVSPLAFNFDTWPSDADKPKPGDVVMFAKYAGVVPQEETPDGRQYRVVSDRDIVAVFDEVTK